MKKHTIFLLGLVNAGGESETELVNKIRQIKARDHCDSFRLKNNETYIVMGMDSKKMEEDSPGDEQ